ncbi:simple sugar transport system permease protein [Pararhizobium capsulatum DSM 1112]|uniref:Simple sugar transport system permease protein n=1 Tax=Pararhizobium capsulatum DSM 1112 TaxID=1121113 RepID=A0ABU0C1P4_9HYPH|nr:ABC transporter permease [Pararhizobium capsulatum]MDQ0323032.1 simple sugar transport system permease protein [Pararhizobium capsulatum DSM 1112]
MKRFLKIYLDKPELAGLALLIILMVIFQVKSNSILLSFENVRGIMGLLPEMALVAIGVTILMICGEFDLSVGSVFALMPMTMAVALTSGVPFTAAVLMGLLLCALIGFINGYITLQFTIPSFITTLGMLFIARSLTIVISGGFPPLLPDDLPTWLFTDYIWQGAIVRMSFIWFLAIALLAAGLLSLTNFGNWIRATGGFNEAAASMGIPVKRVKIICFMLCSVLAGFAGLLQVLRLGSPLPSIGEGLELQAVAAAVIGGTSLAGGIGTVFGAVIGTLLIRTIDNGLVLSRVDANWFKFAIGVLTMFAVIANAWMGKMSRKIKVEAHK